MTAGTLKIAGRKFRVVPEEDYQAMRTALRQQQRQAAEDRADVREAVKRLSDPAEKRIPWSQVKKRGVGMTYRVEFTSSAERKFLRLPKAQRQRVGQRIDALANDPRPTGCVKLRGAANLWRIRCGTYRVVYAIEDAALIVVVVKVGHRREVYRGL